MKKMNVMMSAAVAGLFAVSAHAGNKADHKAMPKTEKDCMEKKMTWKDGACSCAASTDAMSSSTTSTTTTAPAAPAKK